MLGQRSVLLLDGEEHLRRRKLMLPPFHGERMRAYEGVMAEATTRVGVMAGRAAVPDSPAACGDHARRDPAGRVRRGGRPAAIGAATSILGILTTARSPRATGVKVARLGRVHTPPGLADARRNRPDADRRDHRRRAEPDLAWGRTSWPCWWSSLRGRPPMNDEELATSSSRCWSPATRPRPRRWPGHSTCCCTPRTRCEPLREEVAMAVTRTWTR